MEPTDTFAAGKAARDAGLTSHDNPNRCGASRRIWLQGWFAREAEIRFARDSMPLERLTPENEFFCEQDGWTRIHFENDTTAQVQSPRTKRCAAVWEADGWICVQEARDAGCDHPAAGSELHRFPRVDQAINKACEIVEGRSV